MAGTPRFEVKTVKVPSSPANWSRIARTMKIDVIPRESGVSSTLRLLD
jgi:hypothetical protein